MSLSISCNYNFLLRVRGAHVERDDKLRHIILFTFNEAIVLPNNFSFKNIISHFLTGKYFLV